jgi:hypothetical protein
VRGKKRILRVVDRPKSIFWWKFLHLGLLNILIAIGGFAAFLLRRRSRDAYTMSHAA